MKYCVYTRDPGKITTIVETDSLKRAANVYYGITVSCGCPRLSIDGRELRIFEAEEIVFKVIRTSACVQHNAQVRTKIIKERQESRRAQ